MSAEQSPIQTPNRGPGIIDRISNRWKELLSIGAAVVGGVTVPGLENHSVYSETGQVDIGMPFEGKWSYSNLTSAKCGPASTETSHPSCHETYFGDWAADLYGAAGTEVKLQANGESLSFEWDTSAGGTCGETRRVKVYSNKSYVGRVHFTHLTGSASTNSNPTNGMTIGKIANLDCNPGGTVKHVHVEFDNANDKTFSCYINYSDSKNTAGQSLTEGAKLGILGSGNTGSKQECAKDAIIAAAPAIPPRVNAIATQLINGEVHVYWGLDDGTLKETYYRPGAVFTNTVKKYGSAITALSSEYSPSDMNQHVYVGNAAGEVHEVWFGPYSGGYHDNLFYDHDAAITSMATNLTNNYTHEIFWGSMNGRVAETWANQAGGRGTWTIFQSNSSVYGITDQRTPDGTTHIYWGNNEGRLHESFFRPGWGPFTNLMAQFPAPISGLSSQVTPDGKQHIYSSANDAKVRETWFDPAVPGSGYNTWEVAGYGDAAHEASGLVLPGGWQYVFATAGNYVLQNWFYPGQVYRRVVAQSAKPTTDVATVYNPADNTIHVLWGAEDGKVRESWFVPNGAINHWELPA